MSISPLQLRRFWQSFRPAWLAHAGRHSLDPSDRNASEAWRRSLLAEECNGATSLKSISNADYDAVMLRLAVEAGNHAAVSYWAPAAERRLRHLLDAKLADLDRLDPTRPHGIPYLLSILRRSRLRGSLPLSLAALDDLPADHLRTALQILDTHLRRLRARADRAAAPLEPVPF